MGHYDGNTVTALWNYAQHFAMSDNFFSPTFGPSTPGHLNFISGQTHGVIPRDSKGHVISTDIKNRVVKGTLIGNLDPTNDDCSNHTNPTIVMSDKNKNIGDRLNEKNNVTWGWFSAGFTPSIKIANGKWLCSYNGVILTNNNTQQNDYYPDVEPFQYYNSTANPHHLSPTSVAMVGNGDQANHQYNLSMFWRAVKVAIYLQLVFSRPPHSKVDIQDFLIHLMNRLF